MLYKLFEYLLGCDILVRIRPDIFLPSFVRNHFLDGIWAFSFITTLFLLLNEEFDDAVLILISVVCFALFEIGQYFDFISGTPDVLDFGFMVLSSFLGYFLITRKLQQCIN